MPQKLEKCDNCGQTIGNLETPQVWNDRVVCEGCHSKLAAAQSSRIERAILIDTKRKQQNQLAALVLPYSSEPFDAYNARHEEQAKRCRRRTTMLTLGYGLPLIGVIAIYAGMAMNSGAIGTVGLVSLVVSLIVFPISTRCYKKLPVPATNILAISPAEFESVMDAIDHGKLPIQDDVDIPLHTGEVCHIAIRATLLTPTRQRVYVGGSYHGFFAATPLTFTEASYSSGMLYLTSERLVFIAADGSATENWGTEHIVDTSYVRTKEGCSGVRLATTLKRDAGESLWFDGPQEAQITEAAIRKAVECST